MPDPVPVLLRQHDELLAKLEVTADALAALTEPLRGLVAYLESELETHFAIEERELLPRLVGRSVIAPDTIPLLLEEHARARVLTGELARAVGNGGAPDQARLAQEVIDFLRAHIAKEDAMLLAAVAVMGS